MSKTLRGLAVSYTSGAVVATGFDPESGKAWAKVVDPGIFAGLSTIPTSPALIGLVNGFSITEEERRS